MRAGSPIAVIAGPVAGAGALLWTHPCAGAHLGLGADAAWTLALLVWMAIWWMTQAVPMAATSLLPVLLLPLLGIGSFKDSAACYADQVIFLFAGGTVLGAALERHGLSARFTAALLRLAGRSPARVVVALFLAASCISAFVSNTATAAMMLPLAAGIVASATVRAGTPDARGAAAVRNFGAGAMLAVAYGATVGGVVTIMGSPPNAIAAKYLSESGTPVEFVEWLRVGLPVALVFGPLCVGTLLLMLPMHGVELPAAGRALDDAGAHRRERLHLGGWATLAIFTLTVLAWVTAPIWPAGMRPAGLTDGGIAIAAAIALFTLPGTMRPYRPLLDWSVAREMPWGVFILFGGGLALAAAMERSGLSAAIGNAFAGLGSLPAPAIVGIVVVSLVFASEIASNTALTATAVPILGALAPSLGLKPQALVIPAALGASLAFMLPVGTPPNAMAFATGRVPSGTMARVGLVLDLLAAVVVTLLAWLLL